MSELIRERLQEIARAVFDDDDLILDDKTVSTDVPGWDSLGHVTFMYAVEEEFAVEFTEQEFVGFANVGQLAEILRQKAGATSANSS